MNNKDIPEICLNCEHCVYIGEGDSICDVDDPIVIMEDFEPNDNYYYCGGADYESIEYEVIEDE